MALVDHASAIAVAAIAAASACASSGSAAPPASSPSTPSTPSSLARVAFTTGHGEQAPTVGFHLAWMLLAEAYQLTLVNPSLAPIDGSVDVLVIAGPTDAFDARGREEIARFLGTGKGGVFLLDATVMRSARWLDSDGGAGASAPTATTANDTGLDPLLAGYGIRVAPGLILDPPSALGPFPAAGRTRLQALPVFVTVVVQPRDPMSVTGSITVTEPPGVVTEPTGVVFPYASSVEDVAAGSASGRRTWSLASSSPASWRQDEYLYRGFYERAGQPAGPFSIARALELGGAAGQRTRVVVIGDSDFACDEILRLVTLAPGHDGGSRFLRGVIAWAAGRAP